MTLRKRDPDDAKLMKLTRRERLTLALAVDFLGGFGEVQHPEVIRELVDSGFAQFEGLKIADLDALFERLVDAEEANHKGTKARRGK